MAAAIAVGKSLLNRVRSVGRTNVTFFAPEFHCYLNFSPDSCKNQRLRRKDVARELAVLAMLIKGARARLGRARSYLGHIEKHLDVDLEDLIYRVSTGSWKAYLLRVWIMYFRIRSENSKLKLHCRSAFCNRTLLGIAQQRFPCPRFFLVSKLGP